MRLDLPHDLPQRREVDKTPPLEPSPVDRRREQLDARARENRGPETAPPKRTRSVKRTDQSQHIHHSADVRRHVDRRPPRQNLLLGLDLALHAEEQRVLAEAGRFRVIATRDLAETIYGNRNARMERDLAHLRQQGLIEVNAVNARRDGRGGRIEHIEVVTLTKSGQELLRRTGELPPGQKIYNGMVKPREVEHDTQIYRAYLKEAERIERIGGSNLRVQLDFELKSQIQKAIYAARKAEPERDIAEIKQQVAAQLELPYVGGGIQIPDARIEYDLDQGSRTGHQDIEVLTAAYRPGHLRNKAQAGFHVYASSSDRATLTAKVEDEHHLLDNILEL